MTQARDGAAAALLSDGRLIITGGSDSNGVPQASTEIYDPNTGTFSAAPPMNVARANHAAIVLMTGDVLVTGGLTGPGGGYSDSAEIYSANAQQWTLLQASLGTGLAGHAMANLSDGNVLIAGGTSTVGPVSSLLLFKPSDRSISPLGALMTARTDAAAAEAPDGRVLIAGGTDINGAVLVSTEIFAYNADTASGSTSAGPNLAYPRTRASATATYDGVAVIGGSNGTSDLGSAEIFSQWTNVFRVVAGGTPRSHHFAALLPNNGAILALGGTGGSSIDLLQPWANNTAGAFFTGANSLANHTGGIAAPAKLGSLLAAGGQADFGSAAELYWFPTISTDRTDYPPGTPVIMTGTGFQPGETVDLHMHLWSKQIVSDPPDYTVPADDAGSFMFDGYAPNTTDLGARYHLTALGETSRLQAQTVFTDGNPDNTSITVTCSPNPVPIGGVTTCTAEVDNTATGAPNGYPQGAIKFSLTTGTGTWSPSDTCTLAQISSTTKSKCSATLTPTAAGTVKAQYNASPNNWNNGNATFAYTLAQVATNLFVATASGPFGGTISLSATLTAGTTRVGGKLISFTLNGASVGTAITDANGVATRSSVNLSGINVGTYPGAVTASFAGDANYGASNGSNSLIVNQATAVVTLSSLSQTYTGNELTPGASTTPAGLTIVWTGAPQTNAGTYLVTAKVNDPNYTGTASGSFVIDKAVPTLSLSCTEVTFDGNPHSCVGMAKGVGGAAVSGTWSYSPASETNAGSYATTGTFTSADPNYVSGGTADGTLVIDKANATVTVMPYTVTYDGQSHTATATITGFHGESGATVGTVNLSNTTHTNAGTYSGDSWTFTGTANYNDIAATAITDTINKANATVNVTPYAVTYDGQAHMATVTSITGVNGETGATVGTVDVSHTSHSNASTYSSDYWTFTGTANYNDITATAITDTINKANATVNVTPYAVTYDGDAHTATVTSITGVNGETGATVGTVDVSHTTHSNASTYSSDYWTFTGTSNYNDITATAITDTINKADATVNVTPYAVTYDGDAHSATGTAIGIKNESLTGLDLAQTAHTNAGIFTDKWTFTDATGNYNNASGTVSDSIAKASATVNVTPYSVTYDGTAHTATGMATGVKGEALTGLDLTQTAHTNAGDFADKWTFTDSTGNYDNATGTVQDVITKADANVSVTGYSVPYDATEHTATGSVTGVGGVVLTGLSLTGTAHTNAGTYSDTWTFTDATGNYNNASGTVQDVIARVDAKVSVTGYSVTYDATEHTAAGSATGVGGVALTGLSLTGTAHTNAGAYSDTWTFTDASGNYNNATGTVNDSIAKANATLKVTPYSVTYDGTSHMATGTVTGVGGVTLSGLDLTNTIHTNAGTFATDTWTFTDSTGNYNNDSGTVSDAIAKANSTVTITCPASATYNGTAQTPCTAAATGAGGLSVSLTPSYSGNINAGTASVSASYAGDDNHNLSSKTTTFTINKASTTMAVKSSANPSTLNQLLTFTATVSVTAPGAGAPTGIVTFTIDGQQQVTSALSGTTATATFTTSTLGISGTGHTVSVSYNGDANFNSSTGGLDGGQVVKYASGGACIGDAGHQILQPINANGSSIFNAKSTSPAKFRVCDAKGVSIGTPGVVQSFVLYQILNGTVYADVNEPVISTTPDAAFRWDPTGQQWIFNISNQGLQGPNKTYYFRVTLNDGTMVPFSYGLK